MTPQEQGPEDQVLRRAEGFLEARGDRLALLGWSLAAEKLDNAGLTEVVGCIRQQAVRAVPAEEILFLEGFVGRAEEYLRANVGVKHVAGYMATYVFHKK